MYELTLMGFNVVKGMAPMTKDLERAIEAATSKHISVVDGVESAVGSAISMARMGLRI